MKEQAIRKVSLSPAVALPNFVSGTSQPNAQPLHFLSPDLQLPGRPSGRPWNKPDDVSNDERPQCLTQGQVVFVLGTPEPCLPVRVNSWRLLTNDRYGERGNEAG